MTEDRALEKARRAAMMRDAGYAVSDLDFYMALGLLAVRGQRSAICIFEDFWRRRIATEADA